MIRLLLSVAALVVIGASVPRESFAQTASQPDLTALSVEELLKAEVVSTASRFPQEVREAPASITVVTAEDIRRYGHQSLDDVLRSVRGFYTTYDRNYSYIGVRGFARPGDYNTRVLLLVDGQRLNDAIYDMAAIGADFPIDVSLIEKVEVIRGPGSSLYGTSAFFAVINVVTKTGAQMKGVGVETRGGSLGTRGGSASFGHVFSNHSELLIAGSSLRSSGASTLQFPEYAEETPGGVVNGLDGNDASSLFGSFSAGHVSVRGAIANRFKQVPTAAFDTIFGDDRFTTSDTHGYVTAAYDGPLGKGWSGTLRSAYTYYGYEGIYPYDYGDLGTSAQFDASTNQTVSGEATLRRRFMRRHLVTVGTEIRVFPEHRMWTVDELAPTLDVSQKETIFGVYLQDEVRLRPWALLNAGLRADRYKSFGARVTPRIGLVLLPRPQSAVKLLYGQAFRAPNIYERAYFPAMRDGSFTLEPESVQSYEVVWEEHHSNRVRTAVSVFGYDANKIIEQRSFNDDGNDIYFVNSGHVRTVGAEAELEARLVAGVNARFSHTYARSRDLLLDVPFSNSPRSLSKVGLQVPISRVVLAMEGHYVGERLTLAGTPLPGFFVPNVTMTSRVMPRLDLSLSLYNAFDAAYSDPGSEEHRQDSIPQDGRKVMATARVTF